jgi:hypothetical protein
VVSRSETRADSERSIAAMSVEALVVPQVVEGLKPEVAGADACVEIAVPVE